MRKGKIIGSAIDPGDAEFWINSANTCTMPLECSICHEPTVAVYILRAHAMMEADVAEGKFTCGQCEEHGILRRTGEKKMIIQPSRELIVDATYG